MYAVEVLKKKLNSFLDEDERNKNLPVQDLKGIFTEKNLTEGITILFVGTGERFDIKLRNGFTAKKAEKLISNIRRARKSSGLPEMQIIF